MLTLENLSLFYEQDKKILEDITLQVTEGECILLTGESGSGDNAIMMTVQ
jgi:sigma 54 interacting domain protein